MKSLKPLVTTIAVFILVNAALGQALFEQTLAVKVPRETYGPRGMMGDFLVGKDGALWMAFTRNGEICAVKSTDMGKTWG